MSESAENAVIADCSGRTWTVTLKRPQQGNACSAALVAALDETLQRAERERADAVVIRGAGRNFCTGFDLSDIAHETDDSLLARFVRIELMLQRLARAPFLTVAVAHGRAIGAGADIFTACAVRCVEGEASFAFPGARGFGLVLGTRRLCEAVRRNVAIEWIETGRTIKADEALRSGLATHAIEAGAAIGPALDARAGIDPVVSQALRRAASPGSAFEDAADLHRLVESAARPGLRDRIAAYVERGSARTPFSPTLQ